MKKTIIMLSMLIASIGNVYADMKTTIIGSNDYDEIATDVLRLEDGSAIIGGYRFIDNGGAVTQADVFILRVDIAGNIVWQKTIQRPGNDFMQDMLLTTDPATGEQEFVFVCNNRPQGVLTGNTASIYKFDLNGNILSENRYDDIDQNNKHGDILLGLAQISNGDIIAVGVNNDEPAYSGGLICVYDYNLFYRYHEVYDFQNFSDEFTEVTADGNYIYITGFVFSSTKHDLRVSKYQPNTNVGGTNSGTMIYDNQYDIRYNGNLNTYGLDIFYIDNKLLVTGLISSDNNGQIDNVEYAVTLDPIGNASATPVIPPGTIESIQVLDNPVPGSGGSSYVYSNMTSSFPISADRVITIEHPSNSYYEPVFNAAISTIDAKISDITISPSGSPTINNSMLLTIDGAQSIIGIDGIFYSQTGNGDLYMVGAVNGGIANLYGRRDIYFVQSELNLSDDECPIDPFNFSLKQPTHDIDEVTTQKVVRSLGGPWMSYPILDLNMQSGIFCGTYDPPADGCNSDFSIGGSTANPYDIEFMPWVSNSGYNYSWKVNGSTVSNATSNFIYNFSGPGNYSVCLEQSSGPNQCETCLDFCVNDPQRTYTNPDDPCDPDFDWTYVAPNTGSFMVTVTPQTSAANSVIEWGDGSQTNNVLFNTQYVHYYTTPPGPKTICLLANGDPNCKTCLDICLEEPNEGGTISGKKPTGISNEELTLNGMSVMSIHPNPTNYQTTLDLYSSEEKIVEVSLFDVSGRNVLKQTAQLKNGKNSIDIAMDKLNNGMYMLYINDGKHNLVEKVVKY